MYCKITFITLIYFLLVLKCIFKGINGSECPENPDINECTNDMKENEICEADAPLPDGNDNYGINNCAKYDVFKCTGGN